MDDHIDVQATDEGLYDLYVAVCAREGTHPDLSDYLIWVDESGYNDAPV